MATGYTGQIMPRWYGCSGCSGYCDTGCYGTCAGCSGTCEGGCSGYCTSCSGKCKATCKDDCNNTCKGGCTSCSGTCTGTCTGCSGTCSSTCTGGCTGACNATCTGQTQSTNINALSANEILTTSDMTKLATAIKFEVVNRRGGSYTNVTFAAGDLIDDAKIATLIANLKTAGQTAAYSATAGNTALKVLLTDLIAKVKAANNVTIKVS